MKIQISTDYAIRILQYLHVNKEDIHTAMMISQAVGITYPFFIKIANLLKKSGLLYAEQGRKGGYRLGKPADQISIYDVFAGVEGELCLSRCLQRDQNCDRGNLDTCHLRSFFHGVQETLVEKMMQQDIAALTQGGAEPCHEREDSLVS